MNKTNKCKNCQWYGKPYWSIINPCDSCPNENDYKTIIAIDREPLFKEVLTEEEIKKAMTDKSIFEITLEEKDKEIERLRTREQECVDKYLNMSKYASEMEGKYILEKDKNEKAIEYCNYNDESLYTFEPDYDYEENMIDNYEPSNFREDLLNILNGGDDNG